MASYTKAGLLNIFFDITNPKFKRFLEEFHFDFPNPSSFVSFPYNIWVSWVGYAQVITAPLKKRKVCLKQSMKMIRFLLTNNVIKVVKMYNTIDVVDVFSM